MRRNVLRNTKLLASGKTWWDTSYFDGEPDVAMSGRAIRKLPLLLIAFAAALLVAASVMLVPKAYAADASGTSGGVDWSYDSSTQVLTISAATTPESTEYTSGQMPDYDPSTNVAPWASCLSSGSTTVKVSSGVTNIGSNAFYYMSGVTGAEIPASVTSIGKYAFNHCDNLSSVSIASDSMLSTIDKFAFLECSSLTSFSVPASVSTIKDGAFKLDTSLTSVVFPENSMLQVLYSNVFDSCSSLSTIDLSACTNMTGEKPMSYKTGIFASPGLTEVIFPSSLTTFNTKWFTSSSENGSCTGITKVDLSMATLTTWQSKTTSLKSRCENLKELDINPASPIVQSAIADVDDSSASTLVDTASGGVKKCVAYGNWGLLSYMSDDMNDDTNADAPYIHYVTTYSASDIDSVVYSDSLSDESFDSDLTENLTLSEDGSTYTLDVPMYDSETSTFKSGLYLALMSKAEQTITGTESYTAKIDDTVTLDAKSNVEDATLTYASDNEDVATVDDEGTVTITGAGTATITVTASSTDEYQPTTFTVKITGTKKIQSITGTSSYSKNVGGSFALDATSNVDGVQLTYQSTDQDVATVDSDGVVTIKGTGTAYILVFSDSTDAYTSASMFVKIVSGQQTASKVTVGKVKKIKKIKAGKKKAKVSFAKVSGASGYQIKYKVKGSKKWKTVTSKKASKTIKKLKKGKRYKFKVRAYKTVKGKKYYGAYCKVKTSKKIK